MKRYGFTYALNGIANLCQIVMKIGLRRIQEAQRADLGDVRRAKIVEDTKLVRLRQQALTTNTAIHVRRSEPKIDQEHVKIDELNLKIELQKLKILELQRKLGIPDDGQPTFEAANYSLEDHADQAGLQRPVVRRR